MLSQVVLDGLVEWLELHKDRFTSVSRYERVELQEEELKEVLDEYFGTGHRNPEV